jgi:hypothetical protein
LLSQAIVSSNLPPFSRDRKISARKARFHEAKIMRSNVRLLVTIIEPLSLRDEIKLKSNSALDLSKVM